MGRESYLNQGVFIVVGELTGSPRPQNAASWLKFQVFTGDVPILGSELAA